ncbi:hypothetical protein F4777DRAFT_543731 [Nemania sp. FL0916]|nr:hypothetical protein F4777DRAFT_543731 [Nemania sp. FL0916]
MIMDDKPKRHYDQIDCDVAQSQSLLLARNESEEEFHEESIRRKPSTTAWKLHGSLILIYTVVYIIALVATTRIGSSENDDNNAVNLPLPDRTALIWSGRKFPTAIEDNPFTGAPRPELDEAWHNLLQNDNIRVPRLYLEELNLTTIYTLDGSEGIASLSVYHSLHCLKKVKRMLFKEQYHQGKSELAMARESKHVDHCIEYIRESLMCQPDLSLVTFRWINETAQHDDQSAFYPTNFDVAMHTCADWEALDSWASKRVFNLFNVDLLQRPSPYGADL